jgi:hypothetical protein
MALALQPCNERASDAVIILDYEYVHGLTLPAALAYEQVIYQVLTKPSQPLTIPSLGLGARSPTVVCDAIPHPDQRGSPCAAPTPQQ